MTVGRAPGCGVVLDRRHLRLAGARAACSGATARCYVEDLGSTNGTFVNGERITKTTARSARATP